MKTRIASIVFACSMLFSLSVGYALGTRHAFAPTRAFAADDCQSFKETGKSVCGAFLQYWTANGGLAQQGFPISDVFSEKSETDAKTYQVQYFERAVFEMHPELAAPNNVLLTLLGAQKYKTRYNGVQPGGTPLAAATAAMPTMTPVATTVPVAMPTPTHVVAAMAGSVQTFSGTGTKVTQKFSLVAGFVAFKSTSRTGRDNFIAHLTDSDGNELALAANEIGPSTSSAVANIKQDGSYILAVQYDGAWTIEVDNPGNLLNGPISVPTTIVGSGRMVTQPLSLAQGSLTVNYTSMVGRDNFIAYLVDSSGREVGLGANEIGPSNGSRVIRIPASGIYLFGVQYDGKWSLALTQG